MIKAFSDSSTVDNKSAATSIFLTNTQYLGIITDVYTNVESATEGELIAVIQSLKHIKENYPEEVNVVLYCDCISIVSQCRTIIRDKAIPANVKYRKRWEEFLSLIDGLNIRIRHIHAHQESHNSNKVCDKLSNVVAQRMR